MSTYVEFITRRTTQIPLTNGQYNFNDSSVIAPIRANINDKIVDKILYKKFKNINKLVCLDFYGVTSLFDLSEKIPTSLDKCVISYISGSKNTIASTINTIVPRIQSGEIIMGIIVYKKDSMPTCGTKGWIISKIKSLFNNIDIYFIDDNYKNIVCVNNINNKYIKTFFINKRGHNPKEQVINTLKKIS